MSQRRSGQKSTSPGQPKKADTWSHTPFRALKQLAKQIPAPVAVVAAPREIPQPPPEPELDAKSLFERAVAGVQPLAPQQRARIEQPAPASPGRPVIDADSEALAELSDLVHGDAPFDITSSDEHIEGSIVGLDPRMLRKLRNGEFSYQGFLDLHRMTSDEARQALQPFLMKAYQDGKRCVLIIHGRGRNSKDQVPVLKQKVATWLARGLWSHWVLAFTSARPCDGGVGALYVLLRRQRHAKQAIRVTNGAKW